MSRKNLSNLSLIITVYNSEQTIIRALESIKVLIEIGAQVIIVNDASTDSGPLLINNWDLRGCIKLISNPENQGSANSRNLGLQNADRDWVIFLDSDDELMSENVIEILSAADKETELIVAGLDAFDVKTSRKIYSNVPPIKFSSQVEAKKWILAHRGYSRIIYKRTFLLQGDLMFFPEKRHLAGKFFNMDDYFFLLTALAKSKHEIKASVNAISRYYTSLQDRKKYRAQCENFFIGYRLLVDRLLLSESIDLDNRHLAINNATSQYIQCIVELRGMKTISEIPRFVKDTKRAGISNLATIENVYKIFRDFLRVNFGFRTHLRKIFYLIRH